MIRNGYMFPVMSSRRDEPHAKRAPTLGADERLESALRRHGLPVTLQRRTVFACLDGRVDHPTADQLWEAAQAHAPGLSRTTVYRVLDTLTAVGLARKVEHHGSAARFDPRVDRHHHLVCTSCGAVSDFEPRRGDVVRLPSTAETGFEISDYSISFTGTCPDCTRHTRRHHGKRKETP